MNVDPGQLARIVEPFHTAGRGAFVIVRRPWRGERVGEYWFTYGGPAWVCSGWVHFEGAVRPIGPEVVIADQCLRRVNPGHQHDARDTLVAKPFRTA